MLRALWNRLAPRHDAGAVEHSIERQQMRPAERLVVDESAEDRRADSTAADWIGGIDPERLLADDKPPRDRSRLAVT